MAPEDAYGARMDITQPLREYIEENIAMWYKFVKVTLGRTDIHNGDLRVIYGYRKSTGYAIATAFNTDQQTHAQFTFSKDSAWAGTHGCAYRWGHTGSAEVKAGPRHQEISELGSTGPVRNQTLFISTIDPKVSATIWEQIEELTIGVPVNENPHSTSDKSPLRDSFKRQSTKKLSEEKGTEYTSSSARRHYEVLILSSAHFCKRLLLTVLLSPSTFSIPPQSYMVSWRQWYDL